MSSLQVSTASDCTSNPFSILDLKAQAVRLPVSKGSQILLSELLTWSGEKGYCWWSIPKIAQDLNWSVSAVWRKAKELKQQGFLEVIPRPGRSNYWIPLPGAEKIQRIRNELAPLAESRPHEKKSEEYPKRFTVPGASTPIQETPTVAQPNVTALKISSQEMAPLQGTTPDTPLDCTQERIPVIQTPPQYKTIHHKPVPSVRLPNPKTKASLTQEHLFLVEEIERTTGDTWSRGHFLNLVRNTDEQTIYAALSVTREKASLESGVNLGAYFTSTLKGMTGLANLGPGPVADAIAPESSPAYVPSEPLSCPTLRLIPPEEPKSKPIDPESLKRGWRLRYRDAGVEGMLSLVQRCVPLSVDVRGLWVDVRDAFSGVEESVLIDRLLNTVVTRIKHAQRMAQATA
jgi:hypothetical protein